MNEDIIRYFDLFVSFFPKVFLCLLKVYIFVFVNERLVNSLKEIAIECYICNIEISFSNETSSNCSTPLKPVNKPFTRENGGLVGISRFSKRHSNNYIKLVIIS